METLLIIALVGVLTVIGYVCIEQAWKAAETGEEDFWGLAPVIAQARGIDYAQAREEYLTDLTASWDAYLEARAAWEGRRRPPARLYDQAAEPVSPLVDLEDARARKGLARLERHVRNVGGGGLATFALAGLLSLALVGCGGAPSGEGDHPGAGKPGSPKVYAEIAASKSCQKLQATFNRAMDSVERRESGDPLRDVSLAYAEAADARMEAVGCYE